MLTAMLILATLGWLRLNYLWFRFARRTGAPWRLIVLGHLYLAVPIYVLWTLA